MNLLKITLLILLAMTFIISAGTLEKTIHKHQVPSAVLDSFGKQYPNAEVKRYSREIENGVAFYEIESKDGTVSRDLLYTAYGKIVEIEESIPYDSLPVAIKDTVSSKYEKNTFVSAEKVIRPGKPVKYDLVFKVKGKKREIEFSSDGTRVKGKY